MFKKSLLAVLSCSVFAGLGSAQNLITRYQFETDGINSVLGAPDGTLAGGATISSDAVEGVGALQLNGTSAYFDTTTAGLPQGAGLLSGGIELWFKNSTTSAVSNRQLFSNLNASPDSTATLIGTNGAGGLQIFIRAVDGSTYQIRNAIGGSAFNIDTTYADGQWHELTFNWDFTPGGNSGSILVDGNPLDVQVVLNAIDATTDTFNPWEFAAPIGARNNRGTVDSFWPGLIDDVRVYDAPIPEPATATLLGLGALAMLRRRKA